MRLATHAGAALLVAGCATVQDAPRLTFLCPNALQFEVRLYQDMALLEGLRGHAVLERVPGAVDDTGEAVLLYADPTVRARFGLGVDGRLARLDYTGIPEPVTCERTVTPRASEPPSVGAAARPGPRPPPPRPDPNAPVETNIYLGDGKFIHAPRTGSAVRVEDMRVAYWASRFDGARRVALGEFANTPALE